MNTMRHDSPAQGNGRDLLAAPALMHPRYTGLRSAVDRLQAVGIPLRPPTEIREWDGDAHFGRFVQLDTSTCALHVGHGCYMTVDIQRDLNGVTPNEATGCMLCRSGTVRAPDATRSYNAY